MKAGRTCVWVVAAFASTVHGCHGLGRASRSLRASPTPFLIDLPVPTGFELLSCLEGDAASHAGRIVEQQYIGWAARDDLVGFYRSQMPLVRWRERKGDVAGDRYRLRFDRGDEMCTITVRRAGLLSFGRSVVRVRLTSHVGADHGVE